MAELKTKKNDQSVSAFLASVEDEGRRKDCAAVAKIMRKATGIAPKMWGDAIVGFGSHRYRYASGREGDWPLLSFSPRKQNLTLYGISGVNEGGGLFERLGKYKTGKGCLYIRSLEDVDQAVLRELIENTVRKKAAAS